MFKVRIKETDVIVIVYAVREIEYKIEFMIYDNNPFGRWAWSRADRYEPIE